MEYLNLIISLQISFLFLILFFKNNNYLNKLLAVVVIIPVVGFSFNVLDILDVLPPMLFGVIYFVNFTIIFLFAPLLFYYINLMCGNKISIKHPVFIITGIIFLYVIYGIINFIFLDEVTKENYVASIKSNDFPREALLLSILFFIMQQIYFTLSAIKIYKFKKRVLNIFSSRSNVKVEFTNRLIIIVWSANIISLVMYLFMPMRFVEFVMMPIVMFVVTNFIYYYAFEHQVVFEEETYQIFLKDLELIKTSYDISDEEKEESDKKLFAKNIQTFLTNNKSYLNPDYTIFDLSNDLRFNHSEVSNVINKEIGVNFSKLINDYRVEESKTLLKENINSLTVEAIAKMSGFKSRASFYRAFKDKTRITPHEFLKSLS